MSHMSYKVLGKIKEEKVKPIASSESESDSESEEEEEEGYGFITGGIRKSKTNEITIKHKSFKRFQTPKTPNKFQRFLEQIKEEKEDHL